jgi:hypothetical protein
MKLPAFCAVALALSASAFSQTSAPAAPTLTAGAEFKGLRLDWDEVPGATWYQLEYRAHQGGAFVQQGDDFPATATSTRFSFPLHLFDWTYARYRLAACNSAGCSRSAEVSVSDLRRDAVGYFKSSKPQAGARFGAWGDLSPDGYNFVVSAPYEYSADSGSDPGNGAAYVFRRGSDGKWFQRARFDLHNHFQTEEGPDALVTTSGSGNTIAVAMSTYWSGQGTQRGEVDVYYARTGTGRYTATRLPRPAVQQFGTGASLSESGYILAVGVSDAQSSGAIYKSVNGVWQNVRNLPGSQGSGGDSCRAPVLSRDGKRVAQLCQSTSAVPTVRSYVRVYSGSNWSTRSDIELDSSTSGQPAWYHEGLAIDATGDTIAVQFFRFGNAPSDAAAEVRVYKRATTGYSQVAALPPGAWRTTQYRGDYGRDLSLSGDGRTLAIGDDEDNGTGTGPRAAPLVSGAVDTGAVYVYRFTDAWRLANMIKPNYITPPTPGIHGFGWQVSLSGTGKTLLVPVGLENSSAAGIEGDWANSGLRSSGAAFLY